MTQPSLGAEEIAARLSQAVELHQRGELSQAAVLYMEIIRADSSHFDALHLLGVYALQVGDLPTAHSFVTRALHVDPRHAQAHVHFSAILQEQGQLNEALAAIERALELDPDSVQALSNAAGLLSAKLKRPAQAMPLLERALRLDPDHAESWNNMGYALIELRCHEEALPCLARALRLNPGYALALYNQGNALQLLNRTAEAMRSYDAALALAPEMVDAQFGQAACRLLDGDLEPGFAQYEWRCRKPDYRRVLETFTRPLWLGETPLLGKTLLVHREQGFGDTLQMCRYAPLLAAQGARVILRVQPPLKGLLGNVAGVHSVIDDSDPLPDFDLHIPLLSLPMALRTRLDSIPADVPYIQADAARDAVWRRRLGPSSGLRVGLAWAGNPKHVNDAARSIPLTRFQRLLAAPMAFVSLQRDLRAAEGLLLQELPGLRGYADEQTDFAETAALVAQMDLVICVDTAIAHLAGAMGKPVWLLLPFAPDWRWMLERDDSPWYPSMRLFRQHRQGDWDEVLERVLQALTALPSGRAIQ
jgi:tetratricopeptide (TPR) repeat protein